MRTLALWGGGLSSLLLALELLLRLLPVSTATMAISDPQTGRRHYPAGQTWVQSTGWDLRNPQRMQAGPSGYAGAHDLRDARQEDLLLVGDSFVEASMLPLAQRLAAQIESRSGRPVVALGTPGSSLLDFAERLGWALQQAPARDAVMMIETGDVWQSICDAGQAEMRCLDRRSGALVRPPPRPEPGALKQVLRHSALAQYLFSQLKLEPRALWASLRRQAEAAQGHAVGQARRQPSARPMAAADPQLERVEDAFVARLRELPLRKLVLIVDADRPALLRGADGSNPDRERLMTKLRTSGWTVVDAAPLFRAQLARSPLRLEVGPYDAHLNPLALGLLADAAVAKLVGNPE